MTMELVSKLGPGVYSINTRTGERHLYTYLIHDGGEALLIDTGEAGTPAAAILPALSVVGIEASQLRRIVVTHPDVDHQGGIAQMLEFAPKAVVMCGFEDQAMVSDPEFMLQQRYRAYVEHGLDYDATQLAQIRANYGTPAAVATTLVGGERFRVGERELRVHHGPGHSAGHLMIEDPAIGALFISDAVHGRFSPGVDGTPALPPTYEVVSEYLDTIERVRNLAPRAVYSGHFAALHGDAITEFLDQSRAFVDDLDEHILGQLRGGSKTLSALCDSAASAFGPFTVPAFFFMFAVHGHLRRLARKQRLYASAGFGGPPRFSAQAQRMS